ncbi:MAG: nitrogen fixation protein FixH [Pedobacter sp.]|nr:MAG: nitrogen fixation protein FixH [Pedobacter sp.]
MNWGTKIVLGMIAFMLFIVAMVVYMFSVHGNDALVDEDYYEKGINYNKEYNATQNTISGHQEPKITLSDSQLIIQLKDSAGYELKLMRPSTVENDIKTKGSTIGDAHLILIDKKDLPAGLWFLELKWKSDGNDYQFKKSITL